VSALLLVQRCRYVAYAPNARATRSHITSPHLFCHAFYTRTMSPRRQPSRGKTPPVVTMPPALRARLRRFAAMPGKPARRRRLKIFARGASRYADAARRYVALVSRHTLATLSVIVARLSNARPPFADARTQRVLIRQRSTAGRYACYIMIRAIRQQRDECRAIRHHAAAYIKGHVIRAVKMSIDDHATPDYAIYLFYRFH